jgi:hypothetical protein
MLVGLGAILKVKGPNGLFPMALLFMLGIDPSAGQVQATQPHLGAHK